MESKKCKQCGREYEGNFCPECGARAELEAVQKTSPQAPQTKNSEDKQQQVQIPPINPQKKKKPFYLRWWFILLAVLAVGVIVLSVGGKKSKNFSGTYKVEHTECNGSDCSQEELEYLGMDNVTLILNDSGKAYLCINDEIQECNWLKSDDCIMLGNERFNIVNSIICLEIDDYKIYLKKASNSQTIPNRNSETASNTEQSTGSTTSSSTQNEEITSKPTESSSESAGGNLVDGMHKDFKESMDSYEEFMDEYVAFIKKYKANPSDLGLLAEYATFMSKYTDMVSKFDKWESEDLNDAELAYYIDVQARVSKKLLEVAQ